VGWGQPGGGGAEPPAATGQVGSAAAAAATGDVTNQQLGQNERKHPQELNALFCGAVRDPSLNGVLQVHELNRRHQVGPRHGVVALCRRAAPSQPPQPSRAAASADAVASESAFTRIAACAFMAISELKAFAPQTTHKFSS
jgi:hypothetical protein